MSEPAASLADHAACREMIRHGSKSFFTASLVLPARVRQPAYALYAFCRLADDAVDLDANAGAAERLSRRLDRIYRGTPYDHPADRAMTEVVRTHAIPKAVPAALIEGLAWDQEGRRYESFSEVVDYSARVAGTVGVMMALLMGVRNQEALARACDLGVAMQLSNIARDVGEDAANGRLYLPRAWLRAEGIDPDAFLRDPAFSAPLGRVVARLLAEAEALYLRALSGIGALPRDCRPAIGAARLLYREIGREVARRGCNSISSRTVVGTGRKLRLLAAAVAGSVLPLPRGRWPALDEVRFLVESVQQPARPPLAELDGADRVAWVIDLFVELGDRDRTAAWPS